MYVYLYVCLNIHIYICITYIIHTYVCTHMYTRTFIYIQRQDCLRHHSPKGVRPSDIEHEKWKAHRSKKHRIRKLRGWIWYGHFSYGAWKDTQHNKKFGLIKETPVYIPLYTLDHSACLFRGRSAADLPAMSRGPDTAPRPTSSGPGAKHRPRSRPSRREGKPGRTPLEPRSG